jgi:putative inorganic carbon (HCO3(-)) transporter
MIKYLLIFIYLTFLGGTVYTDMNFGLRVAHHLLVSGLLMAWLVGLVRRRESWPRTGLEWPIALFMGIRFVSSLLGNDPRMSLEFYWRPLTHVLLFYWLVWLLRRDQRDPVLRAYFLLFGVVCLVGFIEYAGWYFGIPFLPVFQQGWLEIGGLRDPIPPSNWRLNFTLTNATSLSTYLSLLIPPAIAMAIRTRKRDMRLGWLLLIGAALLVQVLTRSRGGLLGLLVAGAVAAAASLVTYRDRALALWRRLAQSRLFWVGPPLSAALIAVLAVTLLPRYIDRPENLFGRIELWKCAVQTVGLSPLLGVGTGGFGLAWRSCAQTSSLKLDLYTTAHNLYLNLAAESGILGMVAFSLLAAKVVSRARLRWESSQDRFDRVEAIAIAASLAGYAVNMLFDTLPATPLVLPVLFLVAWLVAPLSQGDSPSRWAKSAVGLSLVAVLVYLGGLLWADYAQWHFQHGIAAARRGDHAQALESLKKAQALDPALTLYGFQRAFYLGQLADGDPAGYLVPAIAAQELALQAEDTSSIQLANLAALRWQRGDRDEATAVMERALERIPDEPALWLNYGLMSEVVGHTEQALDAYARALDKEPQWASSGFWVETSFRSQSFDQIILRAVARDASAAELWLAAGDYERALESATAPREADEFAVRGRAYLELGALDRSWLDLEQARQLCPRCTEVYVDRALISWHEGHPQDAEREARTALFISPNDGARAHQVLAWIALDRGDVDAAIDHLQRAVPPQIGDYNWQAVLYNRRGDLGLLPQLVQIEGGTRTFSPWLELAELYLSLDRPVKAADVYRQILARDPFVPGVADRLAALENG